MNTLAVRFPRQFGSIQLSVLLLITMLHRMPVLRLLVSADTLWLRSSLGYVLRSSTLVASALGLVDTLAGATTFTTNPTSPASATVGTPFSGAFALTGANGVTGSYTISGLPPGLTVTGATPSGANFLLNNSTGTISGTPTTAGNYNVSITAWQFANASGDSIPNTYTINVSGGVSATAPSISTQPAGQSVTAGQSASFTVTASGTAPLTYQWRKDGNNIAGATNSTYSIAATVAGDAGAYSVVVTNSAGSVTSDNATLTVNAASAAPSITSHPANQSVTAGQSASFSVTASGTAPLNYQWRKNGNSIGGATGGTYTIASTAQEDAGIYSVEVSNGVGSVTSNDASLTVIAAVNAPAISAQPFGQGVVIGQSAVFSVTASGTAPLSYQWRKNGNAINGATDSTYTIFSTVADDAGTYSVVVSNAAGQMVSHNAALSLAPLRPATFDAEAYLASNPDVSASIGTVDTRPDRAWAHYYLYGVTEGRWDGDFSVQAYLQQYGDLAATFGNDLSAAALHWYLYGRQEGRRVPANFDVSGYLARNPDVAASYVTDRYGAWLHYFNYGVNEGRIFDEYYRPGEYLEIYHDLKAAFGSDRRAGLMHWLNHGRNEGRMGRVPRTFGVVAYLARYPDLQAAFGSNYGAAWGHYLDYGVAEGRTDGDFDVRAYLALYGDLNAAFGEDLEMAALHWYLFGRREGRRIPSGFNAVGYLNRYPDLQQVLGDDLYGAWLHYRDYGVNEGRVYDELFRVDEYLARYPDLQSVFGTDREAALLHWLHYGQYEGRFGRF